MRNRLLDGLYAIVMTLSLILTISLENNVRALRSILEYDMSDLPVYNLILFDPLLQPNNLIGQNSDK